MQPNMARKHAPTPGSTQIISRPLIIRFISGNTAFTVLAAAVVVAGLRFLHVSHISIHVAAAEIISALVLLQLETNHELLEGAVGQSVGFTRGLGAKGR